MRKNPLQISRGVVLEGHGVGGGVKVEWSLGKNRVILKLVHTIYTLVTSFLVH